MNPNFYTEIENHKNVLNENKHEKYREPLQLYLSI